MIYGEVESWPYQGPEGPTDLRTYDSNISSGEQLKAVLETQVIFPVTVLHLF